MNLFQSQRKNLLLFSLLLVGGVAFYVSFYYFWIADFPIGNDVLNHMQMAKSFMRVGMAGFFKDSLYPFSTATYVAEYRVLSFLFNFTLDRSFVFTLCLNLFLVSALAGVLTFRVFKDYKAAAFAVFLVASSRWLTDSLRMGVMAETFGWVFFTLSLLFLLEKRWVFFAVSALLLLFYHPLPFGILGLTAVAFIIYWLAAGNKKQRIFAAIAAVLGIGILIVLSHYFPALFGKILTIIQTKFPPQGDRDILLYATDMEPRRIIVYLLSLVGLAFLIKRKDEKSVLFLIFALLSFFICFKQIFGIHFLGSRFYFYFELSVSILAAYGVSQMCNVVLRRYAIIAFLPLAYLLFGINYDVSNRLTKWELTDYGAGATLPKSDREMAKEIINLIQPTGALVYSNSFWGRWLNDTDSSVNIVSGGYKEVNQPYIYPKLEDLKKQGYKYLYFSFTEPRSEIEDRLDNDVVIDKQGVRLYEIQ